MLFEDLLGIGDPEAELPRIDPDARRRRLTAPVNAASLATKTPAAEGIGKSERERQLKLATK
jgi:hypothetical protein